MIELIAMCGFDIYFPKYIARVFFARFRVSEDCIIVEFYCLATKTYSGMANCLKNNNITKIINMENNFQKVPTQLEEKLFPIEKSRRFFFQKQKKLGNMPSLKRSNVQYYRQTPSELGERSKSSCHLHSLQGV